MSITDLASELNTTELNLGGVISYKFVKNDNSEIIDLLEKYDIPVLEQVIHYISRINN